MSKINIININDFDIKNFNIEPLTKTSYATQKKNKAKINSTFINYNNFQGKTFFECDDIKLVSFSGIPKYSSEYHKEGKNDKQRYKLQINIDTEQENCNKLKKMLSLIDNFAYRQLNKVFEVIPDEMRVADKQYKKLVKPIKNDTDESKSQFKKYERIDMKIPYDENKHQIDVSKFKLFEIVDPKKPNYLKKINNFKTIMDLETYITRNSIIRPTFSFQKAWHNTSGWGINIVCNQIIIVEKGTTNNEIGFLSTNKFIIDDENELSNDSDNNQINDIDKIEDNQDEDNIEDNQDDENEENDENEGNEENNDEDNNDDKDNEEDNNSKQQKNISTKKSINKISKQQNNKKNEDDEKPTPQKNTINKKQTNGKNSPKSTSTTKSKRQIPINDGEENDDNIQSDNEGEI